MENICIYKLQLNQANSKFSSKRSSQCHVNLYLSLMSTQQPTSFFLSSIQLSSLTSRTLLLCKGGTTKTRTAAAIILIKHEIWTQIASKRHSDRYPNTLSKFLASTRTLCYCSETLNRDGVFVPHGN